MYNFFKKHHGAEGEGENEMNCEIRTNIYKLSCVR